MRNRFLLLSVLATLLFSMAAFGQGSTFDPHDFSGIWKLGGSNANAFAGFGPNTMPPLTPQGVEAMKGRIPSRAVQHSSQSNDPEYTCNPAGFPKLLVDSEPMEMIQTGDRLMQVFQWEHRIRFLWMDGRQLPSGENLENLGPAWYGHSVAQWEGDTLVVNTTGLEERAWLDRPGHPKSFHARIEERYKRLDANTIELRMTLHDPEYYTAPWPAAVRTFRREPANSYTYFGWKALFSGITEGICAPVNEVEGYNKKFRDAAEGH